MPGVTQCSKKGTVIGVTGIDGVLFCNRVLYRLALEASGELCLNKSHKYHFRKCEGK